MNVAELVRHQQAVLHLTNKELAVRLGQTPTNIARMRDPNRVWGRFMELASVRKIAEVLQVDVGVVCYSVLVSMGLIEDGELFTGLIDEPAVVIPTGPRTPEELLEIQEELTVVTDEVIGRQNHERRVADRRNRPRPRRTASR